MDYSELISGRRGRRYLAGIDPRLELILSPRYGSDDVQLDPAQEDLVRRASHRYWRAIYAIRDLAADPGYDAARAVEIAREATSDTLGGEPRDDGPHISVRMCRWMASDRFYDLALICDAADTGDEDLIRETVSRRLDQAFVSMAPR